MPYLPPVLRPTTIIYNVFKNKENLTNTRFYGYPRTLCRIYILIF
uniref:Uncharacterized protein n=2 Tax=unclassified Caudoviricetes TaxID=2788787 RepID=A0A8S5MWH6_9CAUD|nr:MAG TPA: hypothetical protein [Siphoviridae sp. ctsBB38]DAF99132.1 MAG TPA: hypothetical protein [Siphoviridae sp. ctOxh11]DAG31192.1 MAG TPA: hypothetical protein [Caudoviricetes sp.]